jgi:AraC-like DNA-binding protein
MVKSSTNVSHTVVRAELSATDEGDGGSSTRLRGLDTNPHGACGPQLWQAFRDSVAHLYTMSLPGPAEEARFTLTTRTYAMPQAILMRCQGTGFTMARGPELIAHGADQLLIVLQIEGSVDNDYGGRRARCQAGDVHIVDYARPFRSAATDYANLMIVVARESVPAALLAMEPHGLVFPRTSGAACLIGAALQEFYAQADHLTMSDAVAAIEGIVALTAACARATVAGEESDQLKSRKKAALNYIDANLANAQLGPDEIAAATNLSRASLYRLMAEEGGIRAVVLKRRLDEALRLMLADGRDEHSLKKIVKRFGFGGMSQFSRAFRARFGASPSQYRTLVRRQNLDWHEARLAADGFHEDAFLWRNQRLIGSKQSGTD